MLYLMISLCVGTTISTCTEQQWVATLCVVWCIMRQYGCTRGRCVWCARQSLIITVSYINTGRLIRDIILFNSNLQVHTERCYYCTSTTQTFITLLFSRPVHFARPTSGIIQFYSWTCPFCLQQVLQTCQAIFQVRLDPQKIMTYQFISTFHDKSISPPRISIGGLIEKQL